MIYNKPELVETTHLLQLTVKLLTGEEMTPFKKVLLSVELTTDGPVRIILIGLQADKTIPQPVRMLLPLVTMHFLQDQAISISRINRLIKEEMSGDKPTDKTQSHTVQSMETTSDMELYKETLTLMLTTVKQLQFPI